MKSFLKTFMLSLLGTVFIFSNAWAFDEDAYRIKVRPNGYIHDKVVGDIITFTAYLALAGETRDSTCYAISVEFDGSELEYPDPGGSPDQGTNMIFSDEMPGDWETYPCGGPFVPDVDGSWNPISGDDTIGFINASKRVMPPGGEWIQDGYVPLVSFDLRLIARLPMDGELDVTLVERDWRGECFGWQPNTVLPIPTSLFPDAVRILDMKRGRRSLISLSAQSPRNGLIRLI